jgi:hypothetical protein
MFMGAPVRGIHLCVNVAKGETVSFRQAAENARAWIYSGVMDRLLNSILLIALYTVRATARLHLLFRWLLT